MRPLRVLLVCTGNTCRSPMAEALFRRGAARRGLEVDVASAGTAALEGEAASPEAVAAMREAGIDLSGHRARRLTPEMVAGADLVLTMTRAQRARVADLVPAAADRVLTLKEFAFGSAKEWEDIPDPIGQPLPVYRERARALAEAVEAALDRIAGERAGVPPEGE